MPALLKRNRGHNQLKIVINPMLHFAQQNLSPLSVCSGNYQARFIRALMVTDHDSYKAPAAVRKSVVSSVKSLTVVLSTSSTP